MIIRVDDIPEQGLKLIFSGTDDVLVQKGASTDQWTIDPRIRGSLFLYKAGDDIIVQGNVFSSIRMTCARCLASFSQETGAEINLVARVGGVEAEFDAVCEDADASVVFFDGTELDVGELILQEFVLDAPMKPLCRPDCPGLCPNCGELKGSTRCTCSQYSDYDPRWQGLARLKKTCGK